MKLTKDREDALVAMKEIQDQCKDKMEKYDEIMAETARAMLLKEKEIGEEWVIRVYL